VAAAVSVALSHILTGQTAHAAAAVTAAVAAGGTVEGRGSDGDTPPGLSAHTVGTLVALEQTGWAQPAGPGVGVPLAVSAPAMGTRAVALPPDADAQGAVPALHAWISPDGGALRAVPAPVVGVVLALPAVLFVDDRAVYAHAGGAQDACAVSVPFVGVVPAVKTPPLRGSMAALVLEHPFHQESKHQQTGCERGLAARHLHRSG